MNTKYLSYINGQFVDNQKQVLIYNPHDNQVIGSVPALNQQQIDDAFSAADNAFEKWSNLSPEIRAKYLLSFGEQLKLNAHAIAHQLTHEIAKGFNEALVEVERSVEYIIETVHEYLDWIKQPHVFNHNTHVQMPKNKIGLYAPKPLGVVLTISPFNYPVNLMIAKIAPALIVGNTLVHKSATQGSIVGSMIGALFDNITADNQPLPHGVFNFVTGKGSEIGDYLIQHPKIAAVSFTGSSEIGLNIARNMAMKPYVLELGGKDPALVLDDADVALAAKEIVKGAFSYSGQRCTAIKRVLVSTKKADTLIPALVAQVQKLSVGSAYDNCVITPLIDNNAVQLAKHLYDDAIAKGAKNLMGEWRTEDNLLHPILLDHVTADMEVAWTEPFAPILPIIRYQNIDEAIELINRSEYGLQGSIFTTSQTQSVIDLAQRINTGTVNINRASSRGPDILPFLGIKNSGFGKQGIVDALESFTRLQGLVLNDWEQEKS